MSTIIIGLLVCVAIAILIVLLVALPGLRSEGRIPETEAQNFRLPGAWTGFDDENSVDDLFTGEGDEFEPAGFAAEDEPRESRRARRQRAKAEREAARAEAGDDGSGGDGVRQAEPKTEAAGESSHAQPVQPVATDVADDPASQETEPEYVPQLQSLRHAMPPIWSARPRTRHWRTPESGDGLKTAAKLLIG